MYHGDPNVDLHVDLPGGITLQLRYAAGKLAAAGSILPVEAWHAAWIADIRRHGANPTPAPMAFAQGKSMKQILAAVKGTGFIVG